MLISCWSVKGGSGTTVVAASLALTLAPSTPSGALLVDLAGDAPAALGMPEPSGPGLLEWLRAAPTVGADALTTLPVAATERLAVLPRGAGVPSAGARWDALAEALSQRSGATVVDAGTWPAPIELLEASDLSLLVIRPCYLALRRAAALSIRPTGIVLVTEPGRALRANDVEGVVGAPVRAEVAYDPAVARAVDAGLLAGRVPHSLAQAMRRAA